MAEALKATSVKDEVIRMIQRLPDDCTLEDIQYHLFVRAKVERVLETLEDGKGLPQAEAEETMEEWLKSFGKTPPSTT